MVADAALRDLCKKVRKYNPSSDFNKIDQAYHLAKFAHSGQFRKSGESFFEHPIAVANIAADLKSDTATVCAALLHDVVEDTSIGLDELKKTFDSEVAEIVGGLTKLEKITFDSGELYSAENLRKMLLASTKDVRILIIKLSDRLHNMQTLKFIKKVEKRQRIAKETKEIYVPIAEKLGLYDIKGKLEDLAFRYLQPDDYQMVKSKINKKREEREKDTKRVISYLKRVLREEGVDTRIEGRAKFFYSIYKKMHKKGRDISEIYDLIAVRIITKTISDAYAALGVVQEIWQQIEGRFKDYIAIPKSNGYQSIHTSVMTNDGKVIEVQIRTESMHTFAEDGVAAHWKYKGAEKDKKFERQIAWLKQILEWKKSSVDAKEFLDQLKVDLFSEEMVCFTPKQDPIYLPVNATPVDFAFMVHSNVGLACVGAKVNGKTVPLDTILKGGDMVEILMNKNSKPSRQWLNFVKTSKARTKIRHELHMPVEHNPKKARELSLKKKLREKILRLDTLIEAKDCKYPIKIAKGCNPKFGDPIIGLITKDKKLTIHNINCPNCFSVDRELRTYVKWKSKKPIGNVFVNVKDKLGVMGKILDGFSRYHVKMISLETQSVRENIRMKISYEKDDSLDMEAFLKAMNNQDFVISGYIRG